MKDWPLKSKLPGNVKGLAHTAYKDKTAVNKLHSMVKTKDKKLKRPEISNSEKVKICMDCMKLADTILKRPHALLCALEDDLHRSLYALYSEINH